MSNDQNSLDFLIDSLDESYTKEWAAESAAWNRLGIYDLLASYVDVQHEGTHLDVGAGLGLLLSKIHRKAAEENKSLRLYGIEANVHMMTTGSQLLSEQQVPALVACARIPSVEETPGGIQIARTFLYHDQFDREKLHRPNVVNFIGDDVRSASVIREIVGDTKLTSGSYTFPGTGSLIYEKPYPLLREITDEEKGKRINELSAKLRTATYTLMTSLMDTNGQLILGERFPRIPGMTNNQIQNELHRSLHQLFGNLMSYWSVDTIGISNNQLAPAEKMDWIIDGKKSSSLEEQGISFGIAIVKLIRNVKQYLW